MSNWYCPGGDKSVQAQRQLWLGTWATSITDTCGSGKTTQYGSLNKASV